jgi:hypothetical protein
MKTRLAVLALALLAPSLVWAGGCRNDTHETTMSCLEGTVWNAEKGVCVPQPST